MTSVVTVTGQDAFDPSTQFKAVTSAPKLDEPRRAWMDSPGNHAVVGWLLGRDAGQLLIKKVDGSVSKVSPNHLWESDRNYAWQATEPRVNAEATVWLGRVVAVMDGDTLAFEKLNREKVNIRLDGIDAPESGVVRFDDRAARRCSKLSAIEKQT